MEALAKAGTLSYLQDAACLNLSKAASALYRIIQSVHKKLRRRSLHLLVHMHSYCQASARRLPNKDNACTYIVQYLEKLLRVLETESRAVTRAVTPSDDHMGVTLFDEDFLQQLANFLVNQSGSEPNPAEQAQFEAYWNGLQTTLP